jgi:HSP20 family molecular chaperone IbpA
MEQRMQQRSARLVHPSMGMYKLSAQSDFTDKGDHYEMVTNIPESKENHIDIRTRNGMISISAKIVHEEQQKTNGMISTSKSIQSYQQSTSLPSDADEGKIKSEFKDGRLVIVIPKKQGSAKAVTPASSGKTVNKPAVEKVKIPSVPNAEKKKEESLPKVDEKLKEKAKPATEEKKEEATPKSEEKKISPSDHSSIS